MYAHLQPPLPCAGLMPQSLLVTTHQNTATAPVQKHIDVDDLFGPDSDEEVRTATFMVEAPYLARLRPRPFPSPCSNLSLG